MFPVVSMARFRLIAGWLGLVACGWVGAARADESPSYRLDVRQVLARGGCTAGPCHGNANGKGGFKLSLRGEDPAADYRAIVRELGGRRIDPFDPPSSLVLLKASGAIAHEGGRRFATNSWEYRTLEAWIAAGAADDGPAVAGPVRLEVTPEESVVFGPATEARLRVWAVSKDGKRREVTDRAVYDPTGTTVRANPDGRVERVQDGEAVVLVRYLDLQVPARIAFAPAHPGFRWKAPKPVNFVDEHIQKKLRSRRQLPAAGVPDELFLRRLHLDLLGTPPTAEEARAFVADRRRDKRARAIDAALERPEFADFWALKWSDLLRVEERTLDPKGMTVFHRWLRDGIATNRPLDVMAREIVSARGSTYANPPANFHRANRTAVDRALSVSQVFLGVRLNCAQCHNHPFDRWTQDDYHDWAAVFGRVRTKVLRNDRRDDNDSHEFSGEQVVYVAATGTVPNPRTGKPAIARLLGETRPVETEGKATTRGVAELRPPSVSSSPIWRGELPRARLNSAPHGVGELRPPDEGRRQQGMETPDGDELDALGGWLTRHPQFARVQVNRIWFHLFGRGLVDPIDDFRATNPASHPELLDALAADLVRHGYDLRHTLRVLLNSRTYQQSDEPNPLAPGEPENFAHTLVRRLSAEQLFDSTAIALEVEPSFKGWPRGTRALANPGALPQKDARKSPADRFLEAFGKPPRLLTCECERSDSSTLSQALQLISGPVVNGWIGEKKNRLARWTQPGTSDAAAVEDLYWSMLTRGPTPAERQRFEGLLAKAPDRRAALEDMAWALLNSKEYVLRR